MAVNGGTGFSAGWRRSPSVKVWPPALHSAVFAPQTSDSKPRTSPPHSCVETRCEQCIKNCSRPGLSYFGVIFCRTLRNCGLQALGTSPWISIALQVLSQVPKEMLLRKEQSHTQRQQLPALQEEKNFHLQENLFFIKGNFCQEFSNNLLYILS